MLYDYTPTSQYYAELIGNLGSDIEDQVRASKQSSKGPILMASEGCENCEGGCSGGCKGSCSGGCSDTCKGTCKDTCSSGCYGGCKGGCSGECSGGCRGVCTADCAGDCKSACLGTCASTCDGACTKTCTGMCEDACQSCQSYCQRAQKYTSNPVGSGKTFSWSSKVAQGETILISATDWNKLVDYVLAAAPYCASSTPSLTKTAPKALITADIFNNMDSGIGKLYRSGMVGTKQATIDIIKSTDFTSLASNYNGAYIIAGSAKCNQCCSQNTQTPESDYGSNQPCKNKQSCSTRDGGRGQSCTASSQKTNTSGPETKH